MTDERPTLNAPAARSLDSITRAVMAATFESVKLTIESKAWEQLGFATIEAWGQSFPKYALPRPERIDQVVELDALGLTQRQIAAVVGVDVATVNRDLHVADATPEAPIPDQDEEDDVANATPEPEPPEPEGGNEAAGQQQPGPTEDEVNANLRVVWATHVAYLARVLSLDPTKYVPLEVANDRDLTELTARTRKWCDAVDAQLAATRGLRIVKGTKR